MNLANLGTGLGTVDCTGALVEELSLNRVHPKDTTLFVSWLQYYHRAESPIENLCLRDTPKFYDENFNHILDL